MYALHAEANPLSCQQYAYQGKRHSDYYYAMRSCNNDNNDNKRNDVCNNSAIHGMMIR